MKKKLFIFMSLLALVTVVLSITRPADAAPVRYQVGYAIKDVNPYIYSENLGIGIRGLDALAEDSEWTVAVDVSDPDSGKTTRERMVRVPLSGYANSAERPSSEIMDDNGDGYVGLGDGLHITCTTVTDTTGETLIYFTVDAISGYENLLNDAAKGVIAQLGSTVQTERVFLNGSHTHEGADFGSVKKTINESSSNRDKLWRAYYDYTVQQMVDAAVECYQNRTEAVMTKGSIDASVSSGYQLNFIRQYKVDEYAAIGNGQYNTMFPSKTYFFGSNFGASTKPLENSALKRTVEHISKADDMMHILQFTPTNGDKPIILVNWRCHATMMSGYTGGGTGPVISADYIAAFRYQMQKAGYRMAFLQGAGGNVISTSSLGTPWTNEIPQGGNSAIYYGGVMLAKVAKDCLNTAMTDELTAGPIRSVRSTLQLEMQKDPEGLIAAAAYYQEQGLSKTNYKYTHTDGKVYIINSKHHARNVVNRSKANPETYADMVVNAFTLGESVAFVTAPTEMHDRYSATDSFKNTSDNDWNDLIDDTYGTPFVMAYTNGHNGYTANKLSYSYNEGSALYGVGSYEANTSKTAPGEGEKIIAAYGNLLDVITEGYRMSFCQHCKSDVEWTPLIAERFSTNYTLRTGHYYLYDDVPLGNVTNYGTIAGEVCLDLNGKILRSRGRSFGLSKNYAESSNLSIMDSGTGGTVEAYDASNSVGGGLISTSNGAVINLYGGTLRTITGENAVVTKGGVISINGSVVNIYGGCIDASQCTLVKDPRNAVSGNSDGCGAAVAVYTNGTLNMFGGRIIAGKAEPEKGRADCVLVEGSNSKIMLSGDAVVDELYFDAVSKSNFKIDNAFTGSVSIRFNPNIRLLDGLDVGNLVNNADLTKAKVTCANSGCQIVASGSNLLLNASTAIVCDGDDAVSYENLQDAINAANGKLIRIRKNVGDHIQIQCNTHLDLNGCSLTGTITVNDGYTLYCMDSATDDYSVSDGKYGRLKNVTGAVAGIPEESDLGTDGYLMLRDNGEISFHRVNLQLTALTLRPSSAGVYYKSSFATDQMVAECVISYGVALSVKAEPTADNIDSVCVRSTLDGFKFGGLNESVASTLLTGIMKHTNSKDENKAYSEIPVWGRAYIQLADGTLVFGASENRSFRQQVEYVDTLWSTLDETQKKDVLEMYESYAEIMQYWEMPNIKLLAK